MYMCVLPARVSALYMCIWYALRLEKGVGFPGIGVPSCGCRESNPGPVQEEQVHLTTEVSLQTKKKTILVCYFLFLLKLFYLVLFLNFLLLGNQLGFLFPFLLISNFVIYSLPLHDFFPTLFAFIYSTLFSMPLLSLLPSFQ